jgi:hypothetical protein
VSTRRCWIGVDWSHTGGRTKSWGSLKAQSLTKEVRALCHFYRQAYTDVNLEGGNLWVFFFFCDFFAFLDFSLISHKNIFGRQRRTTVGYFFLHLHSKIVDIYRWICTKMGQKTALNSQSLLSLYAKTNENSLSCMTFPVFYIAFSYVLFTQWIRMWNRTVFDFSRFFFPESVHLEC